MAFPTSLHPIRMAIMLRARTHTPACRRLIIGLRMAQLTNITLVGIVTCLLHEVRPGLCPLWARIIGHKRMGFPSLLFGLVLPGIWMLTAPPQSHNHHTQPSERVSAICRGVEFY